MAYQFVNPYNFIPLSQKKPDRRKAGAEEGEGTLYTGEITYSLLTKTPLFIPNTSCENVFPAGVEDHKSYDFFSYHDLSKEEQPGESLHIPVIPGSEIRGLIRSNYEILTNSCLSSLDSDNVMSKRTHHVFHAGLIKRNSDGTYDLYKADDCLLRTKSSNCLQDDKWRETDEHFKIKSYIQSELREGQKVWFKKELRSSGKNLAKLVATDEIEKDQEKRNAEGYALKGNEGPEIEKGHKKYWKGMKHCCHIFAHKAGRSEVAKGISLDILKTVIEEYEKNNEEENRHYTEYKNELQKFMKGAFGENSYFPVYYSKIEERDSLYLSPACITREIYERTLGEIAGSHKTCRKEDELCPACRLFGMLGKGENAFAVTSRLRFSDLKFRGDTKELAKAYLEPVTLQPLSNPKLNNMEFYLKRPEDAIFWTYDYSIDRHGNIRKNTEGFNGRKFYWHDMSTASGKIRKDEPTKLNATVRPLNSRKIFSGSIFFEKLTKDELDSLIYTVNTGDEGCIEKKEHGYKLGHAKPLGLGSVALHVDHVSIRSYQSDESGINREISTYEEYSPDKLPALIDRDILENFQIMTAFDSVKGKNIDYPRTEKDGKIYEWYTQNHKAYAIDKKTKLKYTDRSPSQRTQEYYQEYLIPMQTGLGTVDPGYVVEVVGHEKNNVILKNEKKDRISLSFDSLKNIENVQKNAKQARDLKPGTKFKIRYRKKSWNEVSWEIEKL